MTFTFGLGARGEGPALALDTGVPVLAGAPSERIAAGAVPAGRQGRVFLWRGDRALVGFSQTDPGPDIEAETGAVYGDLLRAARGLQLYRIWNFVPRINETARDGLENYRLFCRGRSLAFERALGPGFQGALPAASAVGGPDGLLTVLFLAGAWPARRVENPVQVPAYRYPPEHGPRPPSFARATLSARPGGPDVFISGTSSIVGHETVSAHDTPGQIERTIENLALISRACGLGERLGAEGGCARHFKAYLRDGADQPALARALGDRMLAPGDLVSYLRADVCRRTLNVEIEVALRGPARA